MENGWCYCLKSYVSIHPSIHLFALPLLLLRGNGGSWSQSQQALGERWGRASAGHQSITSLTRRDRPPFKLTFTPVNNIQLTLTHVFSVYEGNRSTRRKPPRRQVHVTPLCCSIFNQMSKTTCKSTNKQIS